MKAAEAFVASGAWVSHLVLAEFIWAMRSVYALGPRALGHAVELLLSHGNLMTSHPRTKPPTRT